MYQPDSEDEIEGFAQSQSAFYEQFLESLQSIMLSVKASGMEVSGVALKNAQIKFSERPEQTLSWMASDRDHYLAHLSTLYELESNEFQAAYDWIVDADIVVAKALLAAKRANKTTFLSGLKFGAAYSGLSDLLSDMHGAMGYIVQKGAAQVRWNVRSKDGRTYGALRYLYPYFKLYARRANVALNLCKRKKMGDKKVELRSGDGTVLASGTPDDLLKLEIAQKFVMFKEVYVVTV